MFIYWQKRYQSKAIIISKKILLRVNIGSASFCSTRSWCVNPLTLNRFPYSIMPARACLMVFIQRMLLRARLQDRVPPHIPRNVSSFLPIRRLLAPNIVRFKQRCLPGLLKLIPLYMQRQNAQTILIVNATGYLSLRRAWSDICSWGLRVVRRSRTGNNNCIVRSLKYVRLKRLLSHFESIYCPFSPM